MLLLAAPHDNENKEKYNPPLHPSPEGNKRHPPLHPSPEGNKKSNNESIFKQFPSLEGCRFATGWV